MNKTSYEKEGLNSLNELFEKLIKCSEENDTKGTMRIVSSLTEEEKDYMYSWAKEQNNLAKVAGIVVEAEMAKKAFDIDCRFKKQVLEALPIQGYCLENDPANPDSLGSDNIKFTDNKYINGKIDLRNRKVYLEARDAENRKYEKTIDYSEVEDLMESINHFRKDIEETFQEAPVVQEEVKEEPFDILNDKEFMKQIGADWVMNLIKKKAEEDSEEGFDSYMTVWLYPGSGANLYGFATEATSEEEALEKVSFYLVQNNLNTFYMTPQEYQDFMKDFYPELSEEELQEKIDNDETVMYVDGGGDAQVYLTGFENAKIEKGINEKYLDQISIIDGPRNAEGPLEKAKKRLEEPKEASQKQELKKKAEGNSAEGEVHIQEILPGKNEEYIQRYKSLDPCAKHIIDVFHSISEDVINRSDNNLKEILNPKAEFEISDGAVFEFDSSGLQRIPEHNAYVIVYVSSPSKDILNSEEENYLEGLHNDITEEFTNWLQKYLDASLNLEKPNKELISTVIDSYDDFYKAIKENLGYELLHNHIITREDGGFFDMAVKNAVQTGKGDILHAEGIISYKELINFLNKTHNI